MPSPESKQLIEAIRAQAAFSGERSLEEMRAGMLEMAQPPDADVTVEQTSAGGVPAAWLRGPEDGGAVVLYLHGGGYLLGSIATHQQLCGWIAKAAGARVLVVDYRLAPEHPFPAAVDDAVAAYRWLLAEGVPPAQVVIAGDSAGGGLAAATLLALKAAGDPQPAGAVLLSPWTDLALTGDSITRRAGIDPMITDKSLVQGMADGYLAGGDARNPLASPLYGDLAGLPPLLIQVGTEEVLLDDAIRFDAEARKAGVETVLEVWDGQVHVFQNQASIVPEAREALERIGGFIRQRVRQPVAA